MSTTRPPTVEPAVSAASRAVFVVFVLAGVNSTGVIPTVAAAGAQTVATALLAAAVTATAIRSPLAQLLEAGPRPLLIILAATIGAFALSLGAAVWLVG